MKFVSASRLMSANCSLNHARCSLNQANCSMKSGQLFTACQLSIESGQLFTESGQLFIGGREPVEFVSVPRLMSAAAKAVGVNCVMLHVHCII